jgi:hypothetical protein
MLKLLFLLFSKILHTPAILHLNFHHVALFQKVPFNQTEYKDVYAIDFSPCGGLIEVISGKKMKGEVRLLHIENCPANNIRERILAEKISRDRSAEILNRIKKIDRKLYDKIQNWDPSFQLYERNCQDFAKYLME